MQAAIPARSTRRAGSKHHLITDGGGIPLAVTPTGTNRDDVTQLLPLLDAVPPVRGRRGRPRRRPDRLYADRAYDHDKHRRQVRQGRPGRSSLAAATTRFRTGRHRWVVEQALALPHWFHRLRIRWEIRDDIHEAS
ncbi:transposase [Actinokineospora sp. 24-640]